MLWVLLLTGSSLNPLTVMLILSFFFPFLAFLFKTTQSLASWNAAFDKGDLFANTRFPCRSVITNSCYHDLDFKSYILLLNRCDKIMFNQRGILGIHWARCPKPTTRIRSAWLQKKRFAFFFNCCGKTDTQLFFLLLCSRASVVFIVEQNSCRNKRRDEGRRKTCLIKIICLELRNL